MIRRSVLGYTMVQVAAIGLLISFLYVPAVLAQEKAEKKVVEEEENVRTGTIASTGSYGHGDQSIDSGSTGAAPGDEASVISAGVGRLSGDSCQVTVSNTSEKNGYSIGYRVIERNQSGRKVNSKYFSDSLQPKESKKREVRCNKGSRMEVELRTARKR